MVFLHPLWEPKAARRYGLANLQSPENLNELI